MQWLVAVYQPVALFSLKSGEATSTGGKSLLVPTPFAIRTALLDVAIRVMGRDYGKREAFEAIRSLRLALRPPERVVVTNLFAKVLKPERDEERGRAMQTTIAFREYAQLAGNLGLAFGGEQRALETVATLLPHISYFGKRGSFFQLMAPPELVETAEEEPPQNFLLLTGLTFEGGRLKGQLPSAFPLGIIQRLDDWGPELSFERVNIYTDEKIRLGRDRLRQDVILPYRVTRAGRGFTLYERF
jgi:hypothetical protein